MSAGGVFKLIANDGKADRMIMATELLNQRIKDIMCMRYKQGFADPTPTLVDLERTHILFVNAHFKPFAAIGYEYNLVKPTSGQAAWGGTVQYSIPQFGDFFNDMVINASLSSVSCSVPVAGSVPAFPGYIGASNQSTSTTAQVSAFQYWPTGVTTAHTYVRYTYNYVTADGTIQNQATATPQNFCRYCEYPGENLFTNVEFDVNGNPLDSYTNQAVFFHQKFRVAPGKLTGWKRLMGQEVPIEAYSELQTINGASVYSSEALSLQLAAGGAAPVGAIPAVDTCRELTYICDGPQTPQATQPALDMWIPLLFWFNKDARLSIPSVAIPYGQRFITVNINSQNNIVYQAPGNFYLQLTVERFDNADGTSTGAALSNYHAWVSRQPVNIAASTVSTSQTFANMDLYINNIFVNPEIHDIYIKRIGFSLIRVYRFQSTTCNTASVSQLLSQLKWPVETMYCGLQPVYNITNPTYTSASISATAGDPQAWRDWHRLTYLQDTIVDQVARSQAILATSNTNPTLITPATAVTQSSQWSQKRLAYPVSTQTLATVGIFAHGIAIFNNFDADFFASYMPYVYGGYNVITPEDPGAIMVNFCLYPGTYQPSGHLNVSRAREFYFNFTSNYCSSANPCNLLVLAIAINFLLISDGSAVLRYST